MASYDEAKLTSTLRGSFSTFNPTTGANQNADSLPTGLVYKLSDGTTLAATVTISNITTGRYRYSVDVTAGNGFAAGEYYELWISAATTGDSTVTQSVPVCGFKAVTTDIDTASAYIDTEVAAIKAKTDNLPSDPADQSAIEAAITAATSTLATSAVLAVVAGYLDTEIAAIKSVTDKIDTGLVLDGAVYQFTANMLELAPSPTGVATLANQVLILSQLDDIQDQTDLIGSASAATSLLAAAVLEPGTITSFPETLTIGDSYTEQNGREIQIPIVDTDGVPLSSTGSLNFADASVTFTLQRAGETDSDRVITGSATFVDPPGTGTGAGAPYAVIELPASETAKGLKKYKYSGILTFTWNGTGTDVMSFETDTVTFEGQ